MKIIPYGKQCIDSSDIAEVVKVLKSDWITQGKKVNEFEVALARHCGVKYAVCVSSGTAALHLACLAAGLKKGDEAITTPITFLATPNSVLYTGARPVFADIDYDTVNIDPVQISKKISKRTKVILPVHFAGLPCDMPEISKIAKKNKFVVIEDASHALGAEYKHNGKWHRIGSCKHSDMTTFSFHPVKHITTGEGGAITTNSKAFCDRLRSLRGHGIHKDKNIAKKGAWYYEMRELGYNYRITDFQCALGISQLRKLNRFIKKRKLIAERYNEAFEKIGNAIKLPAIKYSNKKHAMHLYVLRFNDSDLIKRKKAIVDDQILKKIKTQIHYIPIYKQPYYKKIFCLKHNCSNAEKYYKECISLPMFVSLTQKQQDYVIKEMRRCIVENMD